MIPGDDQATIGFAVPAGLSALAVRYELVAEVGRGGMGVVYKARDRHTGDLVALKVVHPAAASDPRVVERFTNELLLARRITHRNVCRVFDLDQFDGTSVISMELVEGRTLRAVLQDVEALSTRQGMKIVRQIIAGLAEAHAQGVVHRDLKPENILITRDGVVKIMDFGIARLIDSRVTATGQLVGTPAYMSPEQVEGRSVDARSDIYSLGLVMYEMFCGRPAFSADTPIALAAKHVGERPVPPRAIEADLPVRIDAAIRKCLEKTPDKRFQSVAALDAALGGDSVPLDAARSSVVEPERARRWQGGDWLHVCGALVGLAAFLVVFPRVSLAPRSQVVFDRMLLARIAEEYLHRLGVVSPKVKQIGTTLDLGPYIYLATAHGAAAARDAANNPVHYWTWSATFDGGSLNVDNRGRLTSFSRQTVALDPAARPLDETKRQAARAVEELLGQPVSALDLANENRGQVDGFAWLGPPGAQGLRMRYTADVDGAGIAALAASPDLPPGYTMDAFPFGEVTMNEWGLPIAFVIGALVCLFGFLKRHRVAPAPWRVAIVVVAFVAGAAYPLSTYRFFGAGDMIAVPIAMGVLLSAIAYTSTIALEVLSRSGGADRLATLNLLFSRGVPKQAAGVAMLRGTAIGFAVLGIDTLCVWMLAIHGGGRLSLIHLGLVGGLINGSAWPLVLVASVCVLQAVSVPLLVGFVHGATARLPLRPWVATGAGAAVLAATGIRVSMGAVQPVAYTAVVLFVDYALLLAVYGRYDLLTVAALIGTFALWWTNYPLFVTQQAIGAVQPTIAFIVWGMAIAAAAIVAFQDELRRGYRRAAAAMN